MKNRKHPAILFLILTLALSACGSAGAGGGNGSASMDAPQESAAPEAPRLDYGGGPSSDVELDFSQEEAGGSGGSYYDNTKIIRTAELSLQSTQFDAAVEALNALVSREKGYFERSNFSYGGYSSTGERWGEFTVRVPQENFEGFLAATGDVAHVVSRNTGIQDVGEPYYDAELRLKTLEAKHERLLALLEKAELMEDIISLESALSDVEYEIQQYSSTLTRYDALIDFSTVHIELWEVARVTDAPTQTDPLAARLGAAFGRGWHNFCDGLAGLALWGAYHFMGILIFLALAVAAALLLARLYRRRRARAWPAAASQTPPAPPEEPRDGPK